MPAGPVGVFFTISGVVSFWLQFPRRLHLQLQISLSFYLSYKAAHFHGESGLRVTLFSYTVCTITLFAFLVLCLSLSIYLSVYTYICMSVCVNFEVVIMVENWIEMRGFQTMNLRSWCNVGWDLVVCLVFSWILKR